MSWRERATFLSPLYSYIPRSLGALNLGMAAAICLASRLAEPWAAFCLVWLAVATLHFLPALHARLLRWSVVASTGLHCACILASIALMPTARLAYGWVPDSWCRREQWYFFFFFFAGLCTRPHVIPPQLTG